MRCPYTPFATRLSGSAKEMQLRLWSIFQWKKQRPPRGIIVFIILVVLSCGGLVSCRQQAMQEPSQDLDQSPLPELTLSDGAHIYTKLQEPEVAEEAMDDLVTAVYYQTADGDDLLLGEFPFGPDHSYWNSVSLKEFQNVLGHDGVVLGYSSGSASYSYDYVAIGSNEAKLIASANNTAYEIDLDLNGQKELITNYGTNHYLDVYQTLDGEIMCCQFNDLAAASMGLDGTVWVGLFYYPDTGLVTAEWTLPNGEHANRTFELEELFVLAESHWRDGSQSKSRIERAELTNLTLDSDGIGDDTAYLESEICMGDREDSSVTLRILLGTGEELTHIWGATRAYPALTAAHLIDIERDCLVVELTDMTSTYGATTVCVLEMADDQLMERLRFEGVGGSYVEGDTLRLAELVNKWLQPEYYTAVWNGEKFDFMADGFIIEEYPLKDHGATGEQGELTLRLRISTTSELLECEEVLILRGEEVIQNIKPAKYDAFYARSQVAMTPLKFDDVNFDGYLDFGILCDHSVDACHHWYVWDPNAGQYKFFGTLGSDLTVDDTVRQIKETLADGTVNYCGVDAYGKLGLLLRPEKENPHFVGQTAAFQSVLRQSSLVYDATDGNRERKIVYSMSGYTFTPAYFSVVDLERDNVPEVVLWMTLPGNNYVGFDILRWEEGTVVSYSVVYRGLQGLKQDGTYSYSSGHTDHGFGLCSGFGEDGIQTTPITWCQPIAQAPGVERFVDSRRASYEQFNAARARQDEKTDVAWFEFKEENIRILGGIIAAVAD